MSTHQTLADPIFPDCPVRNILARVGDKWSLLVLHTLCTHSSALRFSEIKRALPDIAQKTLTQTLRNLSEDGFVRRKAYAEVPPRVEYTITPRGLSFAQACRPMIEWAIENFAAILQDRAAHRQKTPALPRPAEGQ